MKRLLALFLAAALLCGCTAAAPETKPPEVPTQPSETAAPTQPETVPTETILGGTEAADPLPYTRKIHAAAAIFAGPGYDESYLGSVGEDGVYTIVEEAADPEGNRWGRLKSGAGWVDLTALDVYTPVTAAFADEALLAGGAYIEAVTADSEYATALVFRANELLRGVAIIALEPDMGDFDGYQHTETLYTIHELVPGLPLVAEVVFYGDMTAYGITFATDDGTSRFFAVTISGRNGMPVLTEFTP